jgi:hypothetical protein
MEKNKTGKYLKYAIGEIVLVVIGILIALSINNWNEKQKLKTQEIEILQNFQNSLKEDLKGLNHSISINKRVKNSMNLLLDYMNQDLPYQDSLKYHFGNTNVQWEFNISSSVFDALKSKDLNLISNDSLRQEIIYLHTWSNGSYVTDQKRYRDILENASENILNKRFDEFWKDNYEKWKTSNSYEDNFKLNDLISEMTPNDFESLKKDKEYLYFLKSLRNRFNWYIEMQSESMQLLLKNTLIVIEKELVILQN